MKDLFSAAEACRYGRSSMTTNAAKLVPNRIAEAVLVITRYLYNSEEQGILS